MSWQGSWPPPKTHWSALRAIGCQCWLDAGFPASPFESHLAGFCQTGWDTHGPNVDQSLLNRPIFGPCVPGFNPELPAHNVGVQGSYDITRESPRPPFRALIGATGWLLSLGRIHTFRDFSTKHMLYVYFILTKSYISFSLVLLLISFHCPMTFYVIWVSVTN